MSREMKHSGIPWIGEIPNDWNVNLLSSLFYEHKQKNVGLVETNLLSLSYGKIVRKDINTKEGLLPESFDGYNIISNGDIVFRLTDLQNDKRSLRTGLCKEKGIITSAYVTVRGKQSLNSAYYHYLFHSYDLCKVFYGMGDGVRQGMNFGDLRKLLLLLPPLSEQQKIASFLDEKCSEIDEMVVLQEKIIEELKAYKQSVITEAVTKGFNPDVPMKDSEVDWIGEIPVHWQTVKFKSLFNIKKIIAGKLGYDVLSVTQQGLKVKDLSKNEGQVAQDYSKYQIVNIDDFVMNHMDLLTGYIDCATMSGVTSPDYRTFVNRNHEIADNNFFLQIFQKCYKDKTFYHLGQGVSFLGRWRLPKEQLNAFVLPLPPLNEQKEIANYLNVKCTEIDSLISIKQSKIESLKEYKKSIIYEYVTGKKEVE